MKNLSRKVKLFLLLAFVCSQLSVYAQPYVSGRMWGRLGNHLFIIAATSSVAWDNEAEAVFPDFRAAFDESYALTANYERSSLCSSYQNLFKHLNILQPEKFAFIYREPGFTYSPIPYQPSMLLEGWFQSEKYFAHHKQKIIELFAPSKAICNYLSSKYAEIINHPNTVAIHLRGYHQENSALDGTYPTYGRAYVKKAMQFFDQDVQFVVFSDQIEWAKAQLQGLAANMLFIEGEKYYHDFYLMSMCKHNIISNSTFSWWAAYLNRNADKIIVAPSIWFLPKYNHNSKDLIPEAWISIDMHQSKVDRSN